MGWGFDDSRGVVNWGLGDMTTMVLVRALADIWMAYDMITHFERREMDERFDRRKGRMETFWETRLGKGLFWCISLESTGIVLIEGSEFGLGPGRVPIPFFGGPLSEKIYMLLKTN